MLKSVVYRTAECAYALLPKKAVLKFYCYMAYLFRAIAWRLAFKYFASDMVKYRGDLTGFITSNIGENDSVIDIGCAVGNLTRVIAGKAKKVVAIDIDSTYLDRIDRKDPVYRNTTFIREDIIDFNSREKFDVAVLVHVIEHMSNGEAVLRKIASLASKIIIETPDEEADWLVKLLRDLGIEERGDDKHVKLYDDILMKRELEENGWEDVSLSRGYGLVRAVARSSYLKKQRQSGEI